MSLLGKLFSRPKPLPAFEPWERTPTAKIPRSWQDTRRYVTNSNYLLPKDKEEELRLNFQHYALFHALGNHYTAPLSFPLRTILDVGTGTGIWAVEMANHCRYFIRASRMRKRRGKRSNVLGVVCWVCVCRMVRL